MRRIAANFVPRRLSSDQKEHRISVRTELKEQAGNGPNFISNIITGDESRVFGHNAETKQQSPPNSPRPRKPQVQSNVKSMLILFETEVIVHKEFVPTGETVNGKRLFEATEGKHPAQATRQLAQELLGPASRQRSGSHIASCTAVFGFYEYDSHPPTVLLTGTHPL
jgi:hypothetical protein